MVIEIDTWVPNYIIKCEVCGETPCVNGKQNGKTLYEGTMCGVCTWGVSELLNPDSWNIK